VKFTAAGAELLPDSQRLDAGDFPVIHLGHRAATCLNTRESRGLTLQRFVFNILRLLVRKPLEQNQ
jgi:hypothetical protein